MRRQQHAYGKVHAPDRVGLVLFHHRGFVHSRPAAPHDARLLHRSQQLHGMVSGYGTNITDGLRKGLDLHRRTPPGVLRRIWLLSDGKPNVETERLHGEVRRARSERVNVNTIGFGDEYDGRLLRGISRGTHNGKFVPVGSLRALTNALVSSNARKMQRNRHHRSETTILVIDISGSMVNPMGRRTKIQVVEEAILHLLNYKQRMFS
ncbi:VWA domain-containing protein [Candidatus Poribacteria bacterium]|jgi:Mg-chelatase subunit ChlD|nr:VWA domain-containing protein [Candidatus Poribacteria bacterium]MBT7808068.1 VWA domain-containing protein [Candidatus Poribacteria bacterium]